jgi:3-hydroxyacyl-CoA dehydrogenase
MSELVKYSRDGEVLIITIDNPPVNALSPGVPDGIASGIQMADTDDAIEAVVVIGAGRTFIVGADINEFGKITSGEKKRELGLNPTLAEIENSAKPVIMAIHGTALGGGLEIAMAGHYRVAVASAQVGQPEVKLGLIPGAGGTQRLPRLAGVEKAVQMCVDGNPIKASEAHRSGIIDRIIEGDLLAGAVAFARDVKDRRPRKTRDRNEKLGDKAANADSIAAARENVRKRYRNMIAPQRRSMRSRQRR